MDDYEIQLGTVDCPTDEQLEQILTQVYVGGGFTDTERGRSLLNAGSVRARGELLVAVHLPTQEPVGVVILVPPDSAARRFARADESELHLLGVLPSHRGCGVGRALITKAMARAKVAGFSRMLLWTQTTMKAAHSLYQQAGFVRRPEDDFQNNGQQFLMMHADL